MSDQKHIYFVESIFKILKCLLTIASD